MSQRWSPEEDAKIQAMYATGDVKTLAEDLDRTYDAVKIRAQKLGIKRVAVPAQGSACRLLDKDPIAAYWIGFFAADGSFSDKRLKVFVSRKDEAHIVALASWLGPKFRVKKYETVVGITCQDPSVVARIRTEYGLGPNKTYNPPERLPYTDSVLLKSFLCGFIDGDGQIRKQTGRDAAYIETVGHASWMPFMTLLAKSTGFGRIGTRAGFNGEGEYVKLSCHRQNDLRELKLFAIEHNLPVLSRKWDRINTDFEVTRGDMTARIRELILQGESHRAIVTLTGCAASHESTTRRRMK